jgi:hypothetical protein
MVRFRGYRELTYLLRRIKAWLNNHILVGFEQHDNKAGNEPLVFMVRFFLILSLMLNFTQQQFERASSFRRRGRPARITRQ